MTEREFLRIRDFLKSKYGIDMSHKKTIMEGRLENYGKGVGYNSYDSYMDALESDITGELEKRLVDILTTNHTYFMREPEHFDFFKGVVLPWIKKKEAADKELRIWCAASSTGEEAYTIAMIILDYFGLEKEAWDTQILATDVSTAVLEQAIKGIYTQEQINPLPQAWKRRFFRKIPDEDCFIITDELKREVLYRKFNLMSAFPIKKKMHAIFLRNVLIYFDDNTKLSILKKIYDCLEPGGYLFLGKTETINRQVVPFKLVSPAVFRK